MISGIKAVYLKSKRKKYKKKTKRKNKYQVKNRSVFHTRFVVLTENKVFA